MGTLTENSVPASGFKQRTVSCHPEDRQWFRAAASANKMPLNEMLREALACFRAVHPEKAEKADALFKIWGAAK